MKNLLSLILIAFFCYQVGYGQLKFEPHYPVPGEEITMTYKLKKSPLAYAENISFLLFTFDEGNPTVHEIGYQRTDDMLTATFTTDLSTKLVSVVLKDSKDDKLIDNRDGKGYQKLMCEGEEPVRGAYYQKAMLKNNYSWMVGIDRDAEKALVLMEREIEKYGPLDLKQQNSYITLLNRVDKTKAKAVASTSIPHLKKKSRRSADHMASLKQAYDIAGEKEMAEKIAVKLRKKYPESEFVQREVVSKFFDSKDMDEKALLFDQLKPEVLPDNYQGAVSRMCSDLAGYFAEKSDWDKVTHYMSLVQSDPGSKASAYNALAWTLSGETLEKEAINLEKGIKYSKKSLQYLDKYAADPDSKPTYFTQKRWKESLKYRHSSYADTYALLAFKAGKYDDALAHQQKACEMLDFKNPARNEMYTFYYEQVKGPKATGQILEGLIEEGHSTSKMIDQFKRIFMDHYTKEELYTRVMADLKKKSWQKLEDEILKEMIDLESPAFTLVNLDGQTVSSESLKGKVVVLDFWATWCGPCKKSFPGMQRAVDKYQDDPEVEFLFVDTWEREEEPEKIVRDFIAEHDYRFNVLMDNENKVVADYKVDGIPTKFIIGKDQKIKFKSIGFDGNDDKLVDELSIMIDYLKKVDQKKVKVSMN